MNRRKDNARMTMSVLLGAVLIEVTAFAGINVDPNGMIRLDPNRPVVNWPDRFAEEKYRTDGAEIVSWTQETVLPSPDNAALLYYQAFLLRPEPDDATRLRINDILGDGLPDSSIRAYLGLCRETIHTTEVASLVPRCTWGILHLDPSSTSQTPLLAELRQLGLLLATDARTLAVDGRYEAALARCLTLRRMARHTGDETIFLLLTSWAFDGLAQRATQYVLGLMPPDANTLQGFRGQLATAGAEPSIEKAMQSDLELGMAFLRNNSELLDQVRQQIAKDAPDESARRMALTLTDDEIVARVKEPYARFYHDLFRILGSDTPYEEKYVAIDTRTREFAAACRDDPACGYLSLLSRTNAAQVYDLSVRNAAAYSALKTAIEIYLACAEGGRLPETLPTYTAKDPFSGQEFEYEITASGFVLRCRAKSLFEDRVQQYEFTVRK